MTQPAAYVPSFNFTDWQTSNPTLPPPGVNLDAQFNAIQTTTDQVRTNMTMLQRDDGALANGSVGIDQLSSTLQLTLGTIPYGLTQVGDTNTTIGPGTWVIALIATLTAPRTWTMPAASAFKPGQGFRLVDQAGGVGSVNTLTLAAAGTDTISGNASYTLTSSKQAVDFVSDGVSKWSFDIRGIERGGTGANTAANARINLGVAIGTNVQAWSAQLDAMAALATTGIISRTAANTFTPRAITGTANDIVVSNGDGVAGAPTISIPTSPDWSGKSITFVDTGFTIRANGDATKKATFAATAISTGTTRTYNLPDASGTIPLINQPQTWAGFQSFSAGADLTPAAAPSTVAVGYLGLPQNPQNTNYQLVMGDAGKSIYHTNASAHTITIPANGTVAFPIGTIVSIDAGNGSGVLTIAITTDTLRWIPSNTTGSRTVTAPGTITLKKVSATEWWCWGLNVT